MQIDIDNTPWYDRPWAAFLWFTRLPLRRLHVPARGSRRSVVEFWPLTGWLTGALTAGAIYLGCLFFPYAVALLLALALRLLVAGALQERALAAFAEELGRGDGRLGVVALLFYGLLLFVVLESLEPQLAALCVLAADPFSKMMASQLVMLLPGAGGAEAAGEGPGWRRIGTAASVGLAVQGLVPMAAVLWLTALPWQSVLFVPALAMYAVYLLVLRRQRGYTADSCLAAASLVELSVYLVVSSLVGE